MALTRPITRRLSQPLATRPGQGVVLVRTDSPSLSLDFAAQIYKVKS